MTRSRLLILAILVTAATLVLWLSTGGHWYTKYQVIEQVEMTIDPDDPLALAGFYDEGTIELRTETRDGFYFGLLPTPRGLIDKHMLSVLSIAAPFWLAVGGSLALRRFVSRPHSRGNMLSLNHHNDVAAPTGKGELP
jgi:hypothetical protein